MRAGPSPWGIWASAATGKYGGHMCSAAGGDPTPGMLGVQGDTRVENIFLLSQDMSSRTFQAPCARGAPSPEVLAAKLAASL